MPAYATAAADAIVAALAAGTWSQQFEPRRGYTFDLELADVATIRVDCVPAELKTDNNTRGRDAKTCMVDVAIRLKPAELTIAVCDAMTDLAEEIADALSSLRLSVLATDDSIIRGYEVPTLFSAEHLRKFRQITTVVRFEVFRP